MLVVCISIEVFESIEVCISRRSRAETFKKKGVRRRKRRRMVVKIVSGDVGGIVLILLRL